MPGLTLPVASRPDLVLSKLIWISKGSHKSRRDLRQIMLRRRKRCQDSFPESRSRQSSRHDKTTACGRSGRAGFSEPRTGNRVRSTAACTSPNEIRSDSPPGRWPAFSAGPRGSTSH
jgi:hypothetical protein